MDTGNHPRALRPIISVLFLWHSVRFGHSSPRTPVAIRFRAKAAKSRRCAFYKRYPPK